MTFLRTVLSVLMMTATLSATGLPAGAADATALVAATRPLVIGHRGYSAWAPENTRVAFERALDAGVDLVELDYHHSRDGVPVVIHDGTLDRTTDARARWGGESLPVGAYEAAQLTGLDAGMWFKPPFPGQRVITLEEALEVIQARGVTLIERKAGDAATLSALLRRKNLVQKLVVQAFDWEFLREFHRLEPTQVLGALGPPGSRGGVKLTDEQKALSRAWLDEVRTTGAGIVVWNRQVDAANVRLAHDLGLKVWVYTINEAPVADALLNAGVDGLITDQPALIWRQLALRCNRSP